MARSWSLCLLLLAAGCEVGDDQPRPDLPAALLLQLDELDVGGPIGPAQVEAWALSHGLGPICRDGAPSRESNELGVEYGGCGAQVAMGPSVVELWFQFEFIRIPAPERVSLLEIRIHPPDVELMDTSGRRPANLCDRAARLAWGPPTDHSPERSLWQRPDRLAVLETAPGRLEPSLVIRAGGRGRR
jgi:hypothetical protein